MTNRPCTNYYCPTCGGVVSSWIRHDCIPILLKRIAELTAENTCPTCGGVVSSGVPHECIPILLKRIAELTAENTELRQHRIIMRPVEKRPGLEFPPEYYKPAEEVAKLEAELAVMKRALEMVVETNLSLAYGSYMPKEEHIKEVVERYIGQAQKEMADDN